MRTLLFAAIIAVAVPASVTAQTVAVAAEMGGPVPIPPAERGLRKVIAGDAAIVPGAKADLEGALFDDAGGVLFSDVLGNRVMRLDGAGRFSTVARLDGLMPGGSAIGPDGRLTIAAQTGRNTGVVISIERDGTGLRTVVPESAGFAPNDVVFDKAGGFYFTDARGNAGDLRGGVYYVAAGGGTPRAVLQHLAVANGIALSPDGTVLWVGEFAIGRLHRLTLDGPTGLKPFNATVAYHFIGPAPDSMRTDADGNVYVAMYGQGRVMVFAASGMPIGQILLPQREQGRHLNVTSLAIRPGSRDMAIVTSDGEKGGGTVFRARAFAPGLQSMRAATRAIIPADAPRG